MKVSGNATLNASPARVWAALNDPAVLVRTIPGCERLEEVERDAYRMTVTAGVASIKGTYAGDVQLTDQEEPHAFVLKASGAGGPGTVSADVKVRLADGGDGTTVLSYDADAIVGGMIGGVGQRILSGVAKKTAAEFFQAVDDVLTGAAVTAAARSSRRRAWCLHGARGWSACGYGRRLRQGGCVRSGGGVAGCTGRRLGSGPAPVGGGASSRRQEIG